MKIRLSQLREFAREVVKQLKSEDSDRMRRGVQDNYPGESHSNFEEAADCAENMDESSGYCQHGHPQGMCPECPDPKVSKTEDTDRLRRAEDGHAERVGPSAGKFEESFKVVFRKNKKGK